jgi:hypothetical protein
MRDAIALLSCLAALAPGEILANSERPNLSEKLEYAKRDAAANNDCPSAAQKRYAADFERRYGQRIKRLMKVHLERSGPDPDFIMISSCRGFRGTMAERDALHRKGMKDFEPILRSLEQEFGGY